ncbi:hypothetical protein HG536_0H02460 [Torulaspora globosa]|uniref:t-SNARE coiled-coil homology domain-containing protein n=1 Tax=Torulaspora globosa TaxID=48254 RepID=A0A7G3ZMY5_9SACH|nr:uncharacterized protein HG536_0H02460 [Torulaspora globosa]QLL34871.1 hypothetical protein HG536_0H02460 [Torulaspora globosa]
MANLTSLFREYVKIIEENDDRQAVAPEHKVWRVKQYEIRDSFMKECFQLLQLLLELRKVLKIAEPQYMGDKDMTEEEKDDFDTEFRLQLHQYVQKFKLLEKYEQQRQQLVAEKILEHNTHTFHLFKSGLDDDEMALYHASNNEFRSGVLRSLSMLLNVVSSLFSSMQQERLATQRKFEAFDLNSRPDQLNEVVSISSVSQSKAVESAQEELKIYEDTLSKLTQEQVQMLETEHEGLLAQKDEQLKKIEMINRTILDIVSLQSDISSNLQAQSQNINSILDSQDDIDINIKEGNKQLTRAKRSASRAARMTVVIAIILGVLILFLDYVG